MRMWFMSLSGSTTPAQACFCGILPRMPVNAPEVKLEMLRARFKIAGAKVRRRIPLTKTAQVSARLVGGCELALCKTGFQMFSHFAEGRICANIRGLPKMKNLFCAAALLASVTLSHATIY